MKKLLFPLIFAILLSGCTLPSVGPKNSAVNITSDPVSTVVLDGEKLGQTPFKMENLKSGKHQLRLLPSSGQTWESEITLNSGSETVVNHSFGTDDQESETYIMFLEKISEKNKSEINVVTIPDRAIVRLDGQAKGFAPVSDTLPDSAGHHATISSAGYKEKDIQIMVPAGHRLNLTVQLARTQLLSAQPSASPSATPTASETTENLTPTLTKKPTSPPTPKASPTPPDRPYVEIQSTGTKAISDAPKDNWLRVRSEGNQSASIVSYVYAGETYGFIEASESGWYKIKLSDEKTGWISGQYAKLYK